MTPKEKSIKAAGSFRNSLSWAALITGMTALIGSWASLGYEPTLPIFITLGFLSAWAVICQQSEGFILGKVINIRTPGVAYLAVALVSPLGIALILGAFIGMSIYLILIAWVVSKTDVKLTAGDRFYHFRYPLSGIIPLVHLSDEPLSPMFDPTIAFYWTLGPFNIRLWRISVLDPLALHNHIKSYGIWMNHSEKSWVETLTCFRRAIGLLYLLESVSKFEEYDLDGVALAAGARLALSDIPNDAKIFLQEVLKTMKPDRQTCIKEAFDLT